LGAGTASASLPHMDAFEIAGHAAELLEAAGIVSCARRADGKTVLECYLQTSKGPGSVTFPVGDDAGTPQLLAARCAAWIRARADVPAGHASKGKPPLGSA
jgi:hypothetical protein